MLLEFPQKNENIMLSYDVTRILAPKKNEYIMLSHDVT